MRQLDKISSFYDFFQDIVLIELAIKMYLTTLIHCLCYSLQQVILVNQSTPIL